MGKIYVVSAVEIRDHFQRCIDKTPRHKRRPDILVGHGGGQGVFRSTNPRHTIDHAARRGRQPGSVDVGDAECRRPERIASRVFRIQKQRLALNDIPHWRIDVFRGRQCSAMTAAAPGETREQKKIILNVHESARGK